MSFCCCCNLAPVFGTDAHRICLAASIQFNPVLTWVDGQTSADRARRHPLQLDDDAEEEIIVVCSVKFLTALDAHIGMCRMPTLSGTPLAGSFSLSVELASGEQVGGSEYSAEVASCP